jgi:hypothetical protein
MAKRDGNVLVRHKLRTVTRVALAALYLSCATAARAGSEDVILLPTALETRPAPEAPLALHLPDPKDGRALNAWTRQIDLTLSEAVQDLGLTLDVSGRASNVDLAEDALVQRAQEAWVVSPRLEIDAGRVRLRILAVARGSKVLLMRSQEVDAREAELRALVMMRDLIQTGRGSPEPKEAPDTPAAEGAIVRSARSDGRAVLALNAAAFGGYVGYTIQLAGGSSDARLTYPLIALGTGIGLAGSIVIADEWDVGIGDAWYLSAAAFWPGVAGFLLADGYQKNPNDDRFVYSVLAATGGISLGTTALTFKGMGEGGALLTHSGGAFGLLLGGLAHLAYEGETDLTPSRGMGYGAGLGVLAAGTLATQVPVTPSRVLMIDLGASLGALTGAAAASPLLIVKDEHSPGRTRAWLGTIALGTVAGAGIGWFLTRSHEPRVRSRARTALPSIGVIGESVDARGRREPVFGAALQGQW